MNMKLCSECINRTIVTAKSKSGKNYREYFCSVSGARLKYLKECPLEYDLQEYEELIEKGERFDQLRYGIEMKTVHE